MARTGWPDEDIATLRALWSERTVREISQVFGGRYSDSALVSMARRLDLPPIRPPLARAKISIPAAIEAMGTSIVNCNSGDGQRLFDATTIKGELVMLPLRVPCSEVKSFKRWR